MISEIETIVRCKQPLKIEKPLQCLLPFSYSDGGRNILQIVLSFLIFLFFSFYFFNALQGDNNSNTVYVLGHKYVLGASHNSLTLA